MTKYLRVYKEDSGRWRWIGQYTNSLMDRARIPDIITSNAHRKAVERFEKGELPLPPLCLWHQLEWKVGETDRIFIDEVADDIVFVIATGLIDEDKEYIVPYLANAFSAMSHGLLALEYTLYSSMGVENRDIEDYATLEISALPDGVSAPANPFTYFGIVEEIMVKLSKRAAIEEVIPPELIESIEASNKSIADGALSAGVQHKDNEEMLEEGTEDTQDTQEVDGTVQSDIAEDSAELSGDAAAAPTPAPEIDMNVLAARVAGVLKETLATEFATVAASILKSSLGEVAGQIGQLQASVNTLTSHVGDTDREIEEVKALVGTPVSSFGNNILAAFVKSADGDNGEKKDTEPVQAPNSIFDNIFGSILNGGK